MQWLTPSWRMPSPSWHENYYWLRRFLNLPPFSICTLIWTNLIVMLVCLLCFLSILHCKIFWSMTSDLLPKWQPVMILLSVSGNGKLFTTVGQSSSVYDLWPLVTSKQVILAIQNFAMFSYISWSFMVSHKLFLQLKKVQQTCFSNILFCINCDNSEINIL